IDPLRLFERSARDHERGEDLPEGGIVLPPANLDELEQGLAPLECARAASGTPLARTCYPAVGGAISRPACLRCVENGQAHGPGSPRSHCLRRGRFAYAACPA